MTEKPRRDDREEEMKKPKAMERERGDEGLENERGEEGGIKEEKVGARLERD